jgi:hypothetical protein
MQVSQNYAAPLALISQWVQEWDGPGKPQSFRRCRRCLPNYMVYVGYLKSKTQPLAPFKQGLFADLQERGCSDPTFLHS